jgi:hypothetical protein
MLNLTYLPVYENIPYIFFLTNEEFIRVHTRGIDRAFYFAF